MPKLIRSLENPREFAINDTRRMFPKFSNLAGNPAKGGKFRSTDRVCTIVVAEEDVPELQSMGINVQYTRPGVNQETGEEYIPTPFVNVVLKYPAAVVDKETGNTRYLGTVPEVYKIGAGKRKILYTEDMVGELDEMRESKIDIILRWWKGAESKYPKLFVQKMYFTEAVVFDPFSDFYANMSENPEEPEEEEDF